MESFIHVLLDVAQFIQNCVEYLSNLIDINPT